MTNDAVGALIVMGFLIWLVLMGILYHVETIAASVKRRDKESAK